MLRIITATILLFGFQSNPTLPTIEISSVDMDILTTFGIDCSKFEQSFDKTEFKLRTVKGQREIENILSELKNLKTRDERSMTDTRAQILIRYKDHVDKICADRFSVYQDGTCYIITDRLRKIIW